jgi:hypothetical protein
MLRGGNPYLPDGTPVPDGTPERGKRRPGRPTRGEADAALLRRMEEYTSSGQSDMQQRHGEWNRYRQYYLGDHLGAYEKRRLGGTGVEPAIDRMVQSASGLSAAERADWVTVNLVWAHIETMVPLLANAAPLPYVVSPQVANEDAARTVEEALQAAWHTRGVIGKYKKAVRDQLTLGTGLAKVWWNPTLGPADGNGGRLGDVDVAWQDPYAFYPDPAARDLEEAEYVCLCHDLSADRALRLWPELDVSQAEPMTAEGLERRQTIFGRALNFLKGNSEKYPGQKMLRVWEVYYEGGARLAIYSGRSVVYEGKNPTPTGRYPVVAFPFCEQGDAFWGVSPVAMVEDLQNYINIHLMRTKQHEKLCLDPPASYDGNRIDIHREPGGVTQVGPATTLTFHSPPPLSEGHFQIFPLLQSLFDTTTGIHDILRGLRVGSIQSGVGLESLKESSMARPAELAASNSRKLEEIARLMLVYMQGNYQEPRTFAYMRGQETKRVTVAPEQLRYTLPGVDTGNAASMPGMPGGPFLPGPPGVPDMSGLAELFGGGQSEQGTAPFDFQVTIQGEGELPLNAMAQMEKTVKAGQQVFPDGPAIDRQAYLEGIKFPHTKAILDRMAQAQQAALMGQMMAQAQQEEQMAGQPGMTPEQGSAPPPMQ